MRRRTSYQGKPQHREDSFLEKAGVRQYDGMDIAESRQEPSNNLLHSQQDGRALSLDSSMSASEWNSDSIPLSKQSSPSALRRKGSFRKRSATGGSVPVSPAPVGMKPRNPLTMNHTRGGISPVHPSRPAVQAFVAMNSPSMNKWKQRPRTAEPALDITSLREARLAKRSRKTSMDSNSEMSEIQLH